jgi:hypothetical protein
MSAIERTPYRRPLVDEPRRDLHHAPYASGPSTDSIPSFLSDLQDQPDPREFEPLEASQWTSILARIVAGGLVVLAFAILIALSNSDVARDLIDKARVSIGGATRDQSATQAASNQPAAPQMLLKDDPARASDPVTRTSVNTSVPRLGTASREDIVSDDRAAQHEGTAPSKTLDAETLAALMTRAKSLLALGDIAAARLLLERAANAQDATAAFLLARTYDPAVLAVRDTRSITPDPVMARDWYRKAASFGSAEAQQRLTQLQN